MIDQIVIGRVSSVNMKNNTAKVYREDKGLVTSDLSIVYQENVWYPQVGEFVVCIFLKNSQDGFILGKF